MTFLVTDVPYENCHPIFFTPDLRYSNFWRVDELLKHQGEYSNLTLVALSPSITPNDLEKLTERMVREGINYRPFGEGLNTAFVNVGKPQWETQPEFQEALHMAVNEMIGEAPRKRRRAAP